jgi:hypothetical protein
MIRNRSASDSFMKPSMPNMVTRGLPGSVPASRVAAPEDVRRLDSLHVRLLIRHPNTLYDTQMLPWDGIARILTALVSDSATGHKRQLCDTKTGRRTLSSKKARRYPEVCLAS